MSKSIQTEELDFLFEGILSLKDKEECYRFFQDLCTMKELTSLGQRLEVARMLRANSTYQEVVKQTGASTATISRVNRCINYGSDGYELVLSRLESEYKRD